MSHWLLQLTVEKFGRFTADGYFLSIVVARIFFLRPTIRVPMRHYKPLIKFRALFYCLIDITCGTSPGNYQAATPLYESIFVLRFLPSKRNKVGERKYVLKSGTEKQERESRTKGTALQGPHFYCTSNLYHSKTKFLKSKALQ